MIYKRKKNKKKNIGLTNNAIQIRVCTPANSLGSGGNPYIPCKAKIIEYKRESIDAFTIKVNFAIKHMPGQFVQVTIPGIGEAPISICSYSDRYIKLNVRQVGNVTNALAELKQGKYIFVRGPYGNGYPMKEFEGKGIVLVGGGCGIAPLKGVLDYIENYRKLYDTVSLYLGFRSPKDILFKKEINRWLKVHDTGLSVDSNPNNSCFSGSVGYVTDLVKRSKINPKNKVALLCGPPIMMRLVSQILINKGFSKKDIYISAERMMYCGFGKCGHCMIHGKYVCTDGPVFTYDEIQYKND